MRKHRVTIVLLLLLSGLFLHACGPGQVVNPTFSSPPTTTPASTTNTPVPEPTSADAASAVTMNCDDSALINSGDYRAENNTWGKGDLSGWSQCIGIETEADGTLVGRWTWDWLNSGSNVKAYPEIIFGQKPGTATTSEALPIKISNIGTVTISYDVSSTHTGSGNLAFDLWLTDTPNPYTWGVPPITTEVMIWLDRYGSMQPGGAFRERTSLGDLTYAVYATDKWGEGWKYIAFVSPESRLGVGTLDLGNFFSYMQEKGLVKGDEYLASIEFGNEIAGGAGETDVNKFSISVQTK